MNLDALIPRDDFARQTDQPADAFEQVGTIAVRDIGHEGLIGPLLRKPDFQRETNHWTPDQVASLLECFVNGDLIPSVILWRSSYYIFVIDGGHRLAALRAWVEDDYGDGAVSRRFFGADIPASQLKSARAVRELTHPYCNQSVKG